MEGWIKLNRSILDSKQFARETDLKIWVWIMCKASITERFLTLKTGKGTTLVTLQRGQLIFGRNKAEQELKIDASTIYRVIQKFVEDKAISIEPNNQYSIITVLKFSDYQDNTDFHDYEILEDRTTNEQPMNNQRTGNEQQTNNERTTNEQRMNNKRTHNKKVKKGENVNTVLEGLESKEKKDAEDFSSPNGEVPFYDFSIEDKDNLNGNQETGAEKKLSLYAQFMEIYHNWYKDLTGLPPKIDGEAGKGMKVIISYMKIVAIARAKDQNYTLDPAGVDKKAAQGWWLVLDSWSKIEPFLQEKTKLSQIASEIQNIVKQVKNGTAKHQKQPTGGDITNEDISRAVHEYTKANGLK